MVSLADYLIADSIESYKADTIDGQSVEAIFDATELETRLAYRRTIAADLRALLDEWTRGFVALNTIERALSALIEARATGTVERTAAQLTAERRRRDARAGRHPRRLHRRQVRDARPAAPGRRPHRPATGTRVRFRLEYALVVTFLYDQHYACDEYCKYYKNRENPGYKFIPAVNRTSYDGAVSHVTGIVGISADEYAAMPSSFDGAWLREHFPDVAASMDRFIDKVKAETHGELVGDLQIVRIPLDVYHARNATSRLWRQSGVDHPLATSPVFLLATPPSARPTSSRSRLASSARSSSPGTSATAASRSIRSSTGTRPSCTSSGCASTCAPR